MTERLAIRALRASSWNPNRRVDITEDLAALEREGLNSFAAAIEFLQEYSGLTVRFDRKDYTDEAWFSGSRACDLLDPAWIDIYAHRAGVRLVPVGAAYRDHLTLLIGADGSWYGGFDDEFGLMGGNFLDFLENIIDIKRFIEKL